MTYPIPKDAFDDRLAIVGTAGSGKTYLAMGAMEHLLARHSRVIGVDPLGVMWGLRLCVDGKTPSPFQPVIFGGAHGDLPIGPHAGGIVGEAVATSSESCIIDLSLLGTKAAERRFMLAFLTAFYRHANKEPVHLIVDEADMFAPQKLLDKDGDAAKLLGMMETVVRRGRVRGFIPWLITQRPAVLSKDVLSQADGLVALKLTADQDRKAIKAWVQSTADEGQWKTIDAALPTKQRGDGVLWIPARGILKEVQFPPKATFDSSHTPKRGEKISARSLAPINIGKLKDQLVIVEEEAKRNDPAVLRAEIGKLKAEIGKLSTLKPAIAPPTNDAALAKAEISGFSRGTASAQAAFKVAVLEMQNAVAMQNDTVRKELMQLEAISTGHFRNLVESIPAARVQSAPTYSKPVPQLKPQPPIAHTGDGRALGAERKPLAALVAVYPAGMTEAQWAVSAGLKRSGGTWGTYVSRLRAGGRIEQRDGLFFATESAFSELGDSVPTLPPPGPELVEFWIGKISGVGPMLRVIAEQYPGEISRSDLAVTLNMAESGGTFGTYISRLRAPGLIDVSKTGLRASDALMVGK